ncbi:MAG: DNA-directed RNA polymerase subunit omega [Clostridiales bacterium]|nr:DNA-directed RNA polymerase subunit omega [Clostridiales bacterium]
MLTPSMNELLKRIRNRYLLVNVAAQVAREIAHDAEENDIPLEEKPVTLALHKIAEGKVKVVMEENKVEEPVLKIPEEDEALQ